MKTIVITNYQEQKYGVIKQGVYILSINFK